jgi:uncharacterized protein YydD (DUF2326 family)
MIEIESAIKKSVIDVKGKTFTEIETQQAIRWFKENCCHAYEDDGSVYIEVDNDNIEVFDVQISTSEIAYRADLYRGENK